MSTPNGYETETSWERGRKKKTAPPAEPAPPPPASSAASSAPAPAGVGEGTTSAKDTVIDHRYILGVFVILIGMGAVLVLLTRIVTANQPADQTPVVQATAAPAPTSTPVPTAPAEATFTAIELVDQLIAKKQYDSAAYMAEEALKTTHSEPERAALQERVLSARLHALAAHDPAYIDVPVQQQQVKGYLYLKRKAQAAGVPFLSSLEVAQLASANKHWRWAKFAYEEAYKEGAWSQADDLIMRQYEEVLFRQGWWQANYGTGSTKTEGLRLLALRYTFDTARGRAKDQALTELLKDCDPEKRTCPPPAETPLLPTIQNGGSE